MPLIMTNFLISCDIFNKLDINFNDNNTEARNSLFTSDKLFVYSNVNNILALESKYLIAGRFNDSFENVITSAKAYIKKNRYSSENIRQALCMIIEKEIEGGLLDYFETMAKEFKTDVEIVKRDFDAIYSNSLTDFDLSKVDLTKIYDKAFILNYNELDFIKYITNDATSFPYADRLMNSNLKLFKKMLKSPKFRSYNYISLKNTIVSPTFIESKVYNNLSFLEIIDFIKENAYKKCLDFLKSL